MQVTAAESFVGNMRGPVIGRADADYDEVRSSTTG